MMTARASTLPNAVRVAPMLSFMPRLRNMPKMNNGSSGITKAVTTFMITPSNSVANLYIVSDFTAVMAMPTQKASTRAVMTANGGSISTEKKGDRAPSSTSSTAVMSFWSPNSHGYSATERPQAMRPEMMVEP